MVAEKPGHESSERATDERVSRRTFTRALGAGAGSLALGAGATGSAAARQEQSGLWDTLSVGSGAFKLQVNPWGSRETGDDWDQTIWTESDGSYGYEFGPEGSTQYPNFPQGFIGSKNYGTTTDAPSFPQKRKHIDTFELTVDADVNIDANDGTYKEGDWWNFMCEWWLWDTTTPPKDDAAYEIMLVFDWGDEFFTDDPYEAAVYEDSYGNVVNWEEKGEQGGTNSTFHQFSVETKTTAGTFDLRALMDFLNDRLGIDPELYVSGLEFGNEIYRGVSGSTTFRQVDVTVNDTTYTSGPEGGSGPEEPEQSAYNGPHTIPGRVQAEDFDTGGEGVAYHDTTDGNEGGSDYRDTDVDVGQGNTDGYGIGWIESEEWWEYTVQVEASGTYEFDARVDAPFGASFAVEVDGQQVLETDEFDGEGDWATYVTISAGTVALDAGEHVVRIASQSAYWNFDWFELTATSDPDPPSDGLVVNDFDTWAESQNDLGNWTGAGGFQNDGGEVVDGALWLDYDNSGWMGTVVNQDISDYSQLVLRVQGATGDETDDLSVDWENGRTNLAELTDDAIGTSFGDVTVPLDAIGVDEASPGQLTLNFWQGADSTILIEEIRLA